MNFSLIICTYQRPKALRKLLRSVENQQKYPNQIIIVDGSLDNETEEILKNQVFLNLEYYQVEEANRGLTKQRNYGIERVSNSAEVVCFLDDDIVLRKDYFQELINTYNTFPDAAGVGGYIINEATWKKGIALRTDDFQYDGWVRKLGSRNVLRKTFGLLSDKPPGIMPEFSNGFSIGFLPPSGKVYAVEFFMGGVSSFRKSLFKKIQFSTYFEGYGLYEDMDFCLRAGKFGQLYVNTAAQLYHYHDESGRPNNYNYGKMVIRNGWYVWRVKFENPSMSAKVKWNLTVLLLTFSRLSNVITTKHRREAFLESMGRVIGWWSLLFNKPRE